MWYYSLFNHARPLFIANDLGLNEDEKEKATLYYMKIFDSRWKIIGIQEFTIFNNT